MVAVTYITKLGKLAATPVECLMQRSIITTNAELGNRQTAGNYMYEEICYERSFLQMVIVRTDFLAPITTLEKVLDAKLAEKLSKLFPIVEPQISTEHKIDLDKNDVKFSQTINQQWIFFGKEREKQLSLNSNFASISYAKYSRYENARSDFSAVLDILKLSFPDLRAGRFGLRYINQININIPKATIWNEFIADELIKARDFFEAVNNLTRLMSVVELKYPEMALRFQFGMPNNDFPALIKQPLFVLDYDAYIQLSHDLPEALIYMDKGHEYIQDLYERSITQKLRDRMHVKPNIQD